MIISPPFLSAAHPQQNDSMPTADAGNTVVPDGDVCTASMLECAPGNGAYPVSFDLGWHGGAHLRAPTEGGDALPVQAIADGRIVYVRKTDTTHKPTLQYRNVRTDDGCVVIRHDTEIGEGENAKITYYSVYLHLQQVMPTLAAGNRIYRKDVVGTPGQIFGQYPQIHFEIICSEANLKKMIGRAPAPLGDTPARRDVVYGDMWFFVPRGAKLFASEPHPFRDDDSAPPVATLQPQSPLVAAGTSCDLVIRMHYEKDCTLTTYRQNADLSWSVYGAMPAERDAEYSLYKRATALNGRYTDSSLASLAAGIPVPSPSAIFEMIRFGRCINDQLPAGARFNHWRKVKTPDGDGWINLSKAGVRAYSDADFPEWAGWSFINDDPTPDSLCDSPTVKRWLDVNHAGHVSHADAVTALGTDAIRQRMARAICKFPSEWSRDGLEARYNWLKSPHEALTNPLADEAFTKLIDHARDLAFWEDVSDPDFPHANEVWHFPPTAFVRHFRTCGWFSAAEFKQFVPRQVLREGPHHAVYYENVDWTVPRQSLIRAHGPSLNKMLRKYSINSPERVSAFFGNAMQETIWLSALRENNPQMWYFPWDGRGFLQLTHPENYLGYWDFKGTGDQISTETRHRILQAHSLANSHRPQAQQYNSDSVNGATPLVIQYRKQVGDHDINFDLIAPADSAGFYWSKMGMVRYADQNIRLERRAVSATPPPNPHHPGNGATSVTKIYYHSGNFRDASAIVNLPAAVGHPNHPFNGYVARCVGFGQVLAITSEYLFPDGHGTLLDFPEGCQPRRD
ncbi:M23 family metallopeptidase [Paraburkholderia strydomiana]|uniref:M23 family metallopeptidase n=1 Tax=Paraburkholderia strydomiana TaxID=1245417 RepID=UPI0038B806D9